MDSKLLVRKQPDAVLEPVSVGNLPTLADEAREHLGYSAPGDAVKRKQMVEEKRAIARKALLAIDCRPFDRQSVELYKRRKAWALRNASQKTHWYFANVAPVVSVAALIVTALALGVWGLTFIPAVFAAIGMGVSLLWIAGIASGIFLIAAIMFGVSENRTITTRWIYKNFSSLKAEVPGFALQTAIDLKKIDSSFELGVETLTIEDRREEIRLPDPFLVLTLPGTEHGNNDKFYLEVWDEPSFSGKRLEVTDALA